MIPRRPVPLMVMLLASGCDGPAATTRDPANQFPASLQQAAFEVEVHTDGRATIVADAVAAPSGMPLLGGSVARVDITGIDVGVVGAERSGWRRVAVDLRLTNPATAVALVAPRFAVATPPDRLLLIPLESWAPTSPGEVSVDDGSQVTVELPNRGQVRLTERWSGSPEAFFTAPARCHAVDTRCRPYETLPAPLAPGASSEVQRVSFDLEPTVHRFRFRLVVAGAVRELPATP